MGGEAPSIPEAFLEQVGWKNQVFGSYWEQVQKPRHSQMGEAGVRKVAFQGSNLHATYAAMLRGRHPPVSFSSSSASTSHPGVSAWTGALARGHLGKVPRDAQDDLVFLPSYPF